VGDRGQGGPVTSPPPTTTTTPPGTTPDPAQAGAVDAVTRFVDALGRGDIAQAAALVGVRSSAYLEADTGGSVDDFLRGAAPSYGAWAAATGRTVTAVTIRPGDVVVVLQGTVTIDGTTSERAQAIPARHAESADAWFVEPWAFDPAIGGTIDLLSPDPGPETPQLAAGQPVEVGVPADGSVWMGLGDRPLVPVAAEPAATGGPGRTASWVPTAGAEGRQVLLVAYETDITYTALARIVQVGGPATAG
jgi:hypothetical protein